MCVDELKLEQNAIHFHPHLLNICRKCEILISKDEVANVIRFL